MSETFKNSKESALLCLETFPDAEIVYRGTSKKEKLPWTPLTKSEIEAKDGLFAVILESLPFNACVLDFDIKSEAHPNGTTLEKACAFAKTHGFFEHSVRQKTLNGGYHFLFSSEKKTKSKTGGEIGQGIDLLSGRSLMLLYDPQLWKNIKNLRALPQTIKIKDVKNPSWGKGQNNASVSIIGHKILKGETSLEKEINALEKANPGNKENIKHIQDLKGFLNKNSYLHKGLNKVEEKKNEIKVNKQLENFKDVLFTLKKEVSLNTRSCQTELKINKKWEIIDDFLLIDLFLKAQPYLKTYTHKGYPKMTKNVFHYLLLNACYENQKDPYKQKLKGLKNWDRKKRLETLFETLFEIRKEEELKPIYAWAGKSLFLSIIKRVFEPGCVVQETIVLQGNQGIGKSLFLENLVYNPTQNFSSDLSMSLPEKDFVPKILGNIITEWGELKGWTSEIEQIKSRLTRNIDKHRFAYGKFTTHVKRNGIIVGTTNNPKPLINDPTGLRRFVLISLAYKKSVPEIIKWTKENLDMLYAEAIYLHNKGESHRLPENLWDINAKYNEDHRGKDDTLEELMIDWCKFTLKQSIKKNNPQYHIRPKHIILALHEDKIPKEFDSPEFLGETPQTARILKNSRQGGLLLASKLTKLGFVYKTVQLNNNAFKAYIWEDKNNLPFNIDKETPPF